jgi:hypothetical protein
MLQAPRAGFMLHAAGACDLLATSASTDCQ